MRILLAGCALLASVTASALPTFAATDCQIIIGAKAGGDDPVVSLDASPKIGVIDFGGGALNEAPWFVNGKNMVPFSIYVRGDCTKVTLSLTPSRVANSNVVVPK